MKIRKILLHIVLLAIGFIWIFPFIWTISASLKTNIEMINKGVSIIPESFRWENYAHAWTEMNFAGYFMNTVIITLGTVFIVVGMSALTGYALARVEFPGRNLFIIVITATMFIPSGYTIIPTYMVVRFLGLLDTLAGVILAESGGAHVLFILLFMAYFMKLPQELEESSIIDGCGFLRTFGLIMLPLAKPIIATTAILQFIATWNSFLVPLIFTLNKPEIRTLAVGMYSFVGENTTDWVGMAAGSAISLIPVMLVFIIFQRWFIEGVAGSIKG